VAVLAAAGVLLWPPRFARRRLAILPTAPALPTAAAQGSSATLLVPDAPSSAPASTKSSAIGRARRLLSGRPSEGVAAHDLLGLLEAIAPALEVGIDPASALRFAAQARAGSGHPDPLGALASDIALAAAQGAKVGPMWRDAARSAGSAELLMLAQAWSLTEDMGVPLAQAVRTTVGLLEARIAHERHLEGAVAGARATVNLLTILPVAGPLLALVLGIGPGELYGGSRFTQISLALGLGLAGVGRWWVHRMVRAVARGPVIT
jgi:tight adherence protein B